MTVNVFQKIHIQKEAEHGQIKPSSDPPLQEHQIEQLSMQESTLIRTKIQASNDSTWF